MKIVNRAQMRELDKSAIEKYGFPSILLMENAACRAVDIIVRLEPVRSIGRVAVICGKGGNGGDGLAIARHLTIRFGSDVTIWMVHAAKDLHGDAQVNYEICSRCNITLRVCNSKSQLTDELSKADLIVDAILGTGTQGDVSDDVKQAILAINSAQCPVISIDIPSGLDCDTGNPLPICVKADATVTFSLPKLGLVEYPGASYTGELIVANICIPDALVRDDKIRVSCTERSDIVRWIPPRMEGRDENKGTYGHAGIIAGSPGFAGAGTMAAVAAARIGAGLVTLGVPGSITNTISGSICPVIMTMSLAQNDAGGISDRALDKALSLAFKSTAVAIGPGLGNLENEETRRFVREFVMNCERPLVIDADALNMLSMEQDHGYSVVSARKNATVLTPHPGEMGRLCGVSAAEVQAARRDYSVNTASLFGAVTVLKGARTVIASPDGEIYINTTGNSGMATGGSGDVLTGVITGLLASRMSPLYAAAAGVYIHGLAGDLAVVANGGKAGLIATDIISLLPKALGQCCELPAI